MRAIVLSLALLLASTGAAEAQDAGATEVIASQADSQDRMTIPVHLGRHGPFRFMIDTGSQRTVLSTELASRLGLEATAYRPGCFTLRRPKP